MKSYAVMLLFCLATCLVLACSKPDHVAVFNSPFNEVFYTVETFNGSGPVDPDFTRVYAHLKRDGKSDKKLVMDGGYLDISKIGWTGPDDVSLCMKSGVTNSFHSEVTLVIDDKSETIRNHLQENCTATSTFAPPG